MGRSVSCPSNAVAVFEQFEGDSDDWQWYVEDLRYRAKALFPSLQSDSEWIGREDRAFASNQHAYVGVSEYCGLVAIWLVPRDEDCPLAQHWVEQVAAKFEAEFGSMVRHGSMSNGQGVYVAKAGAVEPAEDVSGDSGHVVINGMLCG
jgi:hypothetical protein